VDFCPLKQLKQGTARHPARIGPVPAILGLAAPRVLMLAGLLALAPDTHLAFTSGSTPCLLELQSASCPRCLDLLP
jgi:hypothetical protein